MGYYIKVEPDVKVYVEDLNEEGRNTIVFLHGWPGSHKLFEYQFNILPKMGYRCIGIDQRGFGESDKPCRGYDYDRLADDVRRVVEVLNLKNFTLLGHSTGGAIAIRYMSRYDNDKVSKLVLCAAAAPSLVQRSYFPHGLQKQAVIDIIKGTYNDRPKMLQDFGDIFFYKHITESFSNWFFQLGLQAAGWATAEVANTWLGEESLFSDLGKINVPTLILHGIHDQVCLFALAKAQKQIIKNSRIIPFTDSGHGLFYDEKEKFNEELTKFIEQ
ncbi:alpha/beta hydrolase [Clostridium sp. MF28]|uniref:alpha/beta fold hydrolase n=1 Tax=Clostridium TaxID=1485 RepID=UPI0003D37E25|nr:MULTISPECIES: alpha/beta hydrolase [Clostridium]ALB44842.1 alpha/beta hydrolase [Clostridium beijerinckii NRRL B-598]AVK47990.1 alpha/beta hydrolase [Clostridium sp. MF28]PSM57384.1 alpha/beta hydrolase [Clostridium diolis]